MVELYPYIYDKSYLYNFFLSLLMAQVFLKILGLTEGDNLGDQYS